MLYRLFLLSGFALSSTYSSIIKLDVKSLLDSYVSYKASSEKTPEDAETLPIVYLPLTFSVDINLARAGENSIVRRKLGSDDLILDEWKLCFDVPNEDGPDCRSLTSGASLPTLHGLQGSTVSAVAAWIEHRKPLLGKLHSSNSDSNEKEEFFIGSKKAVTRYAYTSVAFYVEEPADKGVWFSHLTGGGELTLSQQYGILSRSFNRSSWLKYGPGNDSIDFEDAEKYSFTTEYKMQHDIQQLEHIASKHPDKANWLSTEVIPIYKKVLSRIPPFHGQRSSISQHKPSETSNSDQLNEAMKDEEENSLTLDSRPFNSMGVYYFTAQDYSDGIGLYYNRLLFKPKEVYEDETNHIQLLNQASINYLKPDYEFNQAEKVYRESKPHVAVVDGAISDSTMKLLRTCLEESTFWFETKAPMMGGYVGAYGYAGMFSPMFLKLADEIAQSMPAVFKGHNLRFLWAYKYDSTYEGIAVHADQAAVNVNIWITDDEANLDKEHGGLVVYKSRAYSDEQRSGVSNHANKGLEQCNDFAGHDNITIPYRANRMVIFDSSLHHRTDKLNFKKDKYTNRRINLTLLYGSVPDDRDV